MKEKLTWRAGSRNTDINFSLLLSIDISNETKKYKRIDPHVLGESVDQYGARRTPDGLHRLSPVVRPRL